MNLQAEKLEIVRMVLDTDDRNIIREVKSLLKTHHKSSNDKADLNQFYEGFKDGIHEVKLSLKGKSEVKDAKNWLDELQD